MNFKQELKISSRNKTKRERERKKKEEKQQQNDDIWDEINEEHSRSFIFYHIFTIIQFYT